MENKNEGMNEVASHVNMFEGSKQILQIFDGVTSYVEVLEAPEENLMLVGCGCTARTQRVDQETQ